MADQPVALRLAEQLEDPVNAKLYLAPYVAAELRRLVAENERLHQINQSHEMRLSVRGYEIQIADLKAVNAELLEALKEVYDWCYPTDSAWANKARAAIAKAEEQK